MMARAAYELRSAGGMETRARHALYRVKNVEISVTAADRKSGRHDAYNTSTMSWDAGQTLMDTGRLLQSEKDYRAYSSE